MKLLKLVILICILFMQGCSGPTFKGLSKKIGRKEGDRIGIFKKEYFFEIRNKVIDSVGYNIDNIDTVFMLNKYDNETASYFGMIWSSRDTLSYTYFSKRLYIEKRFFFSQKIISLISLWDNYLLELEKNKYTSSFKDVFAVRAYRKRNKWVINHIIMSDFAFQ